MKLRKRDLFLLVAAPALMLGAIGNVAVDTSATARADEAMAAYSEQTGIDSFNFVGWKFQSLTNDVERCMLAFRITPFQ